MAVTSSAGCACRSPDAHPVQGEAAGAGEGSVLLYRALGLGDFLAAVPAYRAVQRARPDHQIVLAAPAWLEPLARLTGAVDRLLPARELEPLAWAGPPLAYAVNLHGRGPRSHQVLQALRPAQLLAFACPAAGYLAGPRWREDEHETRRWCRLLAHFGIPADPDELDLPHPPVPAPVGGATVVHPGASTPARRWAPERFAQVARYLAGRGHEVVLTGTTEERPLAERVAALAGLPRAAVLAGATTVEELAALVADARLVVSNDTGVAHLASAYRTPSVVLFGPVPPRRWGPPRRPQHLSLTGDAGRIDRIPVARVIRAVARVEYAISARR
ncbi:glycosyltransferase family 9 protein [Carbonactinospora thermoautotrophica]|nr:glycosyltransferase family 9 protein [Carbonactinospora thermoautotrophica]